MQKKPQRSGSTSWEPVEKWYSKLVGEEGHYYHKNIVLPGTLKLLDLKKTPSATLLDLACGQGVLAQVLPKDVGYLGVDISSSLIKTAIQQDKNPLHRFQVGDLTTRLRLFKSDFSHAAMVLAIQNIEQPEEAFLNAAHHLKPGGKLVIVMNHPCFRVPRQSAWQVDQEKKIQYRRIDRYMTSMSIPIHTHPGKGKQSAETVSFHHPLSAYCQWLKNAGFSIETMEEWCSDKISEGGAAKMENRAREEIPLFLAISAVKN
jgi:ubiquinone/menaquinone biosynthesis C-methylase UbiE